MSEAMREWSALSEDWRGQDVPALDLEALRAEAGRQGRRLRRVLVLLGAKGGVATAWMLRWSGFSTRA